MKIEEIIEQYQQDCKLDNTELATESLNTPYLHGKYLKYYSDARLRLRALKLKRTTLNQKLSDYYRGDLNHPDDLKEIGREPYPKKILRQDLRDYVDADKEMVEINTKVAYQDELVDVLAEIIKAINTRGFAIKNAVDFMKFTNGGQ